MGDQDDELVGRFFALARERAGSQQALADLAGRLAGREYRRQAVSNWIHGHADPPASLLLGIARELGISLDELFLSEDERQSVQEQLRELRLQLVVVKRELDRLRSARGEPPVDYGTDVLEIG